MAEQAEKITDDTIQLAASTLTGDVRDFLLDRLKNFKKPWVAMSEDEQRDEIYSAKEAADHLVRSAINIIAAEGRSVITGVLEAVAVKKEIKATITLPKTDQFRHELIDSQGQSVLIVVADAAPFIGEQSPAEPDPDQGDLLDNAKNLKATDSKVKPIKG